MIDEIWVSLDSLCGVYEISSYGRVRSVKTKKILKTPISNCGYPRFYGSIHGKKRAFLVHRLIADAFIPNNERKPFINHIDGDKTNLAISNLEWCTHKENMRHARENGLIDISIKRSGPGEMSPAAKLKETDVYCIRKLISEGVPNKDIAKLFGTSIGNVWNTRTSTA